MAGLNGKLNGGLSGGKAQLKLGLLNSGSLVKAQLIPWEAGVPQIEFMFNPAELTFDHAVEMQESDAARTQQKGQPKTSFSHKKVDNVTISKIVFDCYESGDNVLEKYIEPFRAAVDFIGYHKKSSPLDLKGLPTPLKGAIPLDKIPNPLDKTPNSQTKEEENKRTPTYRFVWGDQIYLRRCLVEKLTYKLTMFLPDGTPVRAVIDSLKLKEADELDPNGVLNAVVDRVKDTMQARLTGKANFKL